MIESKALMIGNWVNDAGMNAMRITEIKDKMPLMYGIKLVSEILEKCGFICTGIQGWLWLKANDDCYLFSNPNGFGLCVESHNDNEDEASFLMPHISELHQLQNLYYLLTGSELPVKL